MRYVLIFNFQSFNNSTFISMYSLFHFCSTFSMCFISNNWQLFSFLLLLLLLLYTLNICPAERPLKAAYSGGSEGDCHWHLSAWCLPWWSPTSLPSGRPYLWPGLPLDIAPCFLCSCLVKQSWWYLEENIKTFVIFIKISIISWWSYKLST